MKPRAPRLSAALLLVLAPSGCGGDALAPPACADGVAITVSRGTTPTMSWTPSCPAAGLTVTSAQGVTLNVWAIFTTDAENTLQPPVRFGELPDGTSQLRDPLPLMSGTRYRIAVLVSEPAPEGGRTFSEVGSLEFEP